MNNLKIINYIEPLKLKEIKLEAFDKEPYAFNASKEDAIFWPDSYWFNMSEQYRLQQSKFARFAEINNQIVGIVTAEIMLLPKNRHTAEIYDVYVKKEYRGQGISKKLIGNIIEAVLQNSEVTKLRLAVIETQKSAIKIYKELGFEQVGTFKKDIKVNDEYFDKIWMEKFISKTNS